MHGQNGSIAPWNNTYLGTSPAWYATNGVAGQGTWANGSLASQIELQNATCYSIDSDCQYYWNSIYPATNTTPYPRLEVYPNNLASITFNVTSSYYDYVFPLAETIFDDGMFRIPINCIFPISGQYDVLSRILFYVLIIAALVFRRHNWLATAALGTAMTYAATTAVHMLALVVDFHFGTNANLNNYNPQTSKPYGDPDVFGCYPVLAAAAIMITPILNWSISIRNSKAQPVVLWWAVLILVALIPAWLRFTPGQGETLPWFNNVPVSFALCPRSVSRQHPSCTESMTLNEDSYYTCQCMDFCSTFSPSTPLRKGANMVAWLSRKVTDKTSDSPGFYKVLGFNKLVLVFVVLQGILGILESQFTQQEVRNLIFRCLYLAPKDFVVLLLKGERKRRWLAKLGMGPAEESVNKDTVPWKIRWQLARFAAAASFAFAAILAVMCPAIFVTTAVANELYVGDYPVSEHSDAVGAWSSWVATGAVVIAGGIIRYRDGWDLAFKRIIFKIHHWLAYDEHERPKPKNRGSSDQQMPTMSSPTDGTKTTLTERKNAFVAETLSPFRHAFHSIVRGSYRVAAEFSMFRKWWNNPEVESKRRHEEIVQEVETQMSNCPPCPCHFCYRHHQHGDDDEASVSKDDSTWGQRLVSGMEKTYSQHKSGGKGRHASYEYSKALQSDVSEPASTYDLPQIPPSAPLSLEDSIVGRNSPEDENASYPLEPQPVAYGRPRPDYENLSHPRRGFQRQNSEQLELVSSETTDFRIPRKKVGSGSPSIASASEYQRLLGGQSPEIGREERQVGD